MSNRQYKLLHLFYKEQFIYFKDAGKYNQTTMGSLGQRGFIVKTSSGFKITKSGAEAFREFEQVDIMRKLASLNFAAFFTKEVKKLA